MIRRYPMRICLVNIISYLCIAVVDPWLIECSGIPIQNRAPIGLFSLPYLFLLYGGFLLVGLRIGYTTFRKEIGTNKEILIYTAVIFFVICCIESILNPPLFNFSRVLIIATQESVGFLLGGLLGLAKAKKQSQNNGS